jgi:hypothetical protein
VRTCQKRLARCFVETSAVVCWNQSPSSPLDSLKSQ